MAAVLKRSLVLVGTALLMSEVRAILQRQPIQQLYLLTFSHILHDSVEQHASVGAPRRYRARVGRAELGRKGVDKQINYQHRY